MLRSNNPVTLQFPPFRGFIRRIVLMAAGLWVLFAVIGMVMPGRAGQVESFIALTPELVRHGFVWLPFTYSFAPNDLLSEVFALFTVWIFAAQLQDDLGERWMREFFFVVTVGGGLLTCLVSYVAGSHVPLLGPMYTTGGMWPLSLALVVAFARHNAETKIRFDFIFKLKAKYLAAAYVAFYACLLLLGGDKMSSLAALCVALVAYVYLRLAPRRGIGFSASESWYGLRNAFYRNKRRRAAKKFTVYMKKQGSDVSIDETGRYVDPSGTPRDPNDKRWMN